MAGSMPRIGPDPFEVINRNNELMYRHGMQNEQNAQEALMRVFITEASRQEPFVSLPTALAKQNNAADVMLDRQKQLHAFKEAIKAPLSPNEASKLAWDSAKTFGVDPVLVTTIIDLESGFNPRAKNPKSSAYGLMQQLDKNWAQYGRGLDRNNPEHQIRAGIAYIRDVQSVAEKFADQIKITPGIIYFGYQQGPGALQKVLANPHAPAEQVLGREAVLINGGRRGESAWNFMQRWAKKADNRYAQHLKVRSRKNDKEEETSPNDILAQYGIPPGTPDETRGMYVGKHPDSGEDLYVTDY